MDLHIVTLNIPYPPDYGGMIDTYYRIKALHTLDVRIHLHCFEYGRSHSSELESLCATTNYYPRKSGILKQLSLIPYIVASRESKSLLDNLVRNDWPILFDGLHSTLYIDHPALSGQKKIVRLHNIEHKYYSSLAANEHDLFKKTFYQIESARLKQYDKVLRLADSVLPISEGDHEYFENKFHNSTLLSPFHPYSQSESQTGTGEYIIYHGDLSVNENSAVANSLILNVYSRLPYKCIIAGKDPPEFIRSSASRYQNIGIVSNPNNDEMRKLISNAHINLLPALANNGFKLKLLMALYGGRHCLINSIVGSERNIKSLCNLADSNEEIIDKIHLLMKMPFTEEMILDRRKVLTDNFSVLKSAEKLISIVFGTKFHKTGYEA